MISAIGILATGAGGAGTVSILREFRKLSRYRLFAVDSNPMSVGLHLAEKSFVVPVATDPEYLDVMTEIICRNQVRVLVPLIDEELLKAWEIRARVGRELLLALPTEGFVRLTLDKGRMAREFGEAGISVPRTMRLTEALADGGPVRLPAVVKPNRGRGSRGVVVLRDETDFHRHVHALGPDKVGDHIIQDYVEGVEYTVSVVASSDGRLLAVVPKQVIEKRGITRAAVTRRNEAITDVCRRIQQRFRADGPFNVQLILDRDGRPVVFEVNPRFSTTVSLTMAAGVNEVEMVIRDRLGESVEQADFIPDLYMVRYEESLFKTEAELSLPC